MLENFNQNLIKHNDHLIVAVSGGIDSMVLLDYLIRLKESLSLKISVAHIDHQKRQNSCQDADFVKRYAKDHQLDFYLYQLDDNKAQNFHDYAHKKRYDFFADTAKKYHASKIVLAHHLDDLAETIMMRLIRGSSFEGYMGIPETSTYNQTMIIRPMLHVSKASIKAYQKHYHIAYKNDQSNQEDTYTRNRFRHRIMPLLNEENPKYLEKINQFSKYQSMAYELIEKDTLTVLKSLSMSEDKVILDSQIFNKQVKIIQFEIIKRIINHLSQNQIELSYQNIEDIIDLILSDKPHMSYGLGDALYIYKSYDQISFQTQENDLQDFQCTINDFGHFTIDSKIKAFVAKKADKSYDYIYKLCYNNLDLTFPLILRNRRPGDRLDIKIGTKKLKDFFIDKKVPMHDRNHVPLIVNQKNDILFIPNLFSKKMHGKNYIYIHLNIQ